MNRFSLPAWMASGLACIWLSAGPSTALAQQPPPARGDDRFHLFRPVQQLWSRAVASKTLEIVEMARAISKGSQMGPGEGWFHPSQDRYGWKSLAARHGVSAKDVIERAKFRGPAEFFQRLDRNRDGVLDATDFDWSERSPHFRQAGLASMWYSMIDGNSNGRISREEWATFFGRLAKGKDYLTPDDLREAMTPPAPPRTSAPRPGGPSRAVLLKGLFHGELGSFFEGPDVGDRAIDFTLKTHDGKKQVRLSQYRGHKPVVLIFGNFT